LFEIVEGLHLTDAWTQDPRKPAFAHYSPTGATRIDCFYLTRDLVPLKVASEIFPVAFTDHEVLVLRISFSTQEPRRRRGRWKTDPFLVAEPVVKEKIKQAWEKWAQRKRFYDSTVMWWERCVKSQLQRLLQHEEGERRRDYKQMENHLYECLYDILGSTSQPAEKL
jgi:hypothetical protein